MREKIIFDIGSRGRWVMLCSFFIQNRHFCNLSAYVWRKLSINQGFDYVCHTWQQPTRSTRVNKAMKNSGFSRSISVVFDRVSLKRDTISAYSQVHVFLIWQGFKFTQIWKVLHSTLLSLAVSLVGSTMSIPWDSHVKETRMFFGKLGLTPEKKQSVRGSGFFWTLKDRLVRKPSDKSTENNLALV